MKRPVKAETKRGAKRDLFAELSEGIASLAQARQGKRELRTHSVGPQFARQVETGERVMREDRDALRKLAE
jgi:hypothetical protein